MIRNTTYKNSCPFLLFYLVLLYIKGLYGFVILAFPSSSSPSSSYSHFECMNKILYKILILYVRTYVLCIPIFAILVHCNISETKENICLDFGCGYVDGGNGNIKYRKECGEFYYNILCITILFAVVVVVIIKENSIHDNASDFLLLRNARISIPIDLKNVLTI